MKRLFLSLMATAISFSSLNLPTSSAANGNCTIENSIQEIPKLAEMRTGVPGTSSNNWGGTNGDYHDADGPFSHGEDDSFSKPNFIGYSGTITGTIRYSSSDFMFDDWSDDDWFLFTTPKKYRYTFSFDAPNYLYKYEVCKFTENRDLVFESYGTGFKQAILVPGSYYIHIYHREPNSSIDGNAEYHLTFNFTSLTSNPVKPADHIDPFGDNNEVIVWQNDAIPYNAERWGAASQPIHGGISTGWIDPLYCGDDYKVKEQYGIDSVIYLFDRTYLKEIAENCEKLAYFIGQVELNEITAIRREKNIREENDFYSISSYYFGLISLFCPDGADTIISGVSLLFSTLGLIHMFGETWQYNDMNFAYAGYNLAILKENCERALRCGYGIRLPRFSRIRTENFGNKVFWETSLFGNTQATSDYYLIKNENDLIQPVFTFTDCDNEYHEAYGSFSFYKDMDDFSSKTNFTFDADVQQVSNGTVDCQTPTRALKSISLGGNYKTSFMAGEQFNTDGLCITAKYNDGFEETINNLGSDNILTNADMYTEGQYTVVVKYEAPVNDKTSGEWLGNVTKYKKYIINVTSEKETHYSYASFELCGSDLTYINHGQTYYFINTIIQIPIENGDPSIWSSVSYLGYDYIGSLDVFYVNVYVDRDNGYFEVHVRSNNGVGRSTIYLDFSYQTVIPLPELESITVSEYQEEYFLGDDFNSDLVVTEHFASGETINTNDYYLDSSNFSKYTTGTYTIFVTCTVYGITKSTSFTVSVRNPRLDEIVLSTRNCQTVFEVGESFNSNGLSVIAIYENDDTNLVNGFEVDTSNVNMNQPGEYTVNVSYTENDITVNATYQITVLYNGPALTSITLSGDYQTSFEVGEAFNHSGLVVAAHYSDGTSRVVSGYSVMPLSYDPYRPGTYNVIVNYSDNGGFALTSYSVTVEFLLIPVFLDSITLSGNYQTNYRMGQALNFTGLVVTANYTDGSSEEVTDYVIDTSAVNMLLPGYYDVRVLYTFRGTTVVAVFTIHIGRFIKDSELPTLPDDPIKPFPGKF